ncbi:MAG TPA: hypothetical protein VLX29_03040 [Nitrospirota bacterium]|nr:hypothetical protein [Nitrospirota bacterium]
MDCLEKYSGIVTALLTLGLLIVAWSQLNKFRNQVKVDLLFRIYKDIRGWLDNHLEAKKWIYEISEDKQLKYDEWWMDDFLVTKESKASQNG